MFHNPISVTTSAFLKHMQAEYEVTATSYSKESLVHKLSRLFPKYLCPNPTITERKLILAIAFLGRGRVPASG